MTNQQPLVERERIVARLMDLEGKPYFTDGRGPSPVHEIRELIESDADTITRLTAERDALRGALRELETHVLGRHGHKIIDEALARATLKESDNAA